ncbi:MAG: hypothetical protein SV186_01260 [Candidatus Nanohaloarchaea archaeon]|nr:hypothetical protein [Candidatus Nanohaloarchaea archaeon]
MMKLRKASTAAPLFIMAMLAGIGGIAYMMSLPGGVQATVQSGIEETRTATKAKAFADYISEDYTGQAIRYNMHSVTYQLAKEGGKWSDENWVAGESIPSEDAVAQAAKEQAAESFMEIYLGSGSVQENGDITVPDFSYNFHDRYGVQRPYKGLQKPVETGPETNRTKWVLYEGEYHAGFRGMGAPPRYRVTVDYTFDLQYQDGDGYSDGGSSASIMFYTSDGDIVFQDQASADSGGGSNEETFTMELRKGNRLKMVLEAQSTWSRQQVQLNSIQIEPLQPETHIIDLSGSAPSAGQTATARARKVQMRDVKLFKASHSGEYTIYFDYRLEVTHTEEDANRGSHVRFKVKENDGTIYTHTEQSRDPATDCGDDDGCTYHNWPSVYRDNISRRISLNKGGVISVTMLAETGTGNPMSAQLEAFRIIDEQTGKIVSNLVQGLNYTARSSSPTKIQFSRSTATTTTYIPTERTQYLRGNRFFYLYNVSETLAKSWGLRNITADSVANVSNYIALEKEQNVGTCPSDASNCEYNKNGASSDFDGSYPGTGSWELALNRQEEAVAPLIQSKLSQYEENVFTPSVLVPPFDRHYGNISVDIEVQGVEYEIDSAELVPDDEGGKAWSVSSCAVSETSSEEKSTSCGSVSCDADDIGSTSCETSGFGESIPTRSGHLPDDYSINIIGLTPPKAGLAQKIPQESTQCSDELYCSGSCYEHPEDKGDGDYKLLPDDREETDPYPLVEFTSGSGMLSSYVTPVRERTRAASANGEGDKCDGDYCCDENVNYNEAYQTGRKVWRIKKLTSKVTFQVTVTDERYYVPTREGQKHMKFVFNYTQTSTVTFNEDGTIDELSFPKEPSPCWEWRPDADGDRDNRCRE